MQCRKCFNKISEIDLYCRQCGLRTYNEDKEITEAEISYNKEINSLNLQEDNNGKKKNLIPLIIGICVILVLILIMIVLLYTIIKNS